MTNKKDFKKFKAELKRIPPDRIVHPPTVNWSLWDWFKWMVLGTAGHAGHDHADHAPKRKR